MVKRVFIFILVTSLVASYWCVADEGASTRTTFFPRVETGVRSMGMGGAYVALADDPEGVFWNPGALGLVKGSGIFTHYTRLYNLPGVNYGAAALVMRSGFLGVGVGGTYLDLGKELFEGVYDSHGNPIEPYGFTEYIGVLGIGLNILEFLGVGASVRLGYDETVYKAMVTQADVGALLRLGPVRVGAVVENAYADVLSQEGIEVDPEKDMPMNVRAGAALDFGLLVLAADIDHALDEYREYRAGAEINLFDVVKVRGGICYDQYAAMAYGEATPEFEPDVEWVKDFLNRPSVSYYWGVGLKVGIVELDYAQCFHVLSGKEPDHRFAISLVWAPPLEKPKPPKEKVKAKEEGEKQ